MPLVEIPESWGNNIFLEASSPFSFPAYRHNKKFLKIPMKTIQQTFKCLLYAQDSAVHKNKIPDHVELNVLVKGDRQQTHKYVVIMSVMEKKPSKGIGECGVLLLEVRWLEKASLG